MFRVMNTSNRFTLYSGPLSMFGAKVQIAALEKGLTDYFEREGIDSTWPPLE